MLAVGYQMSEMSLVVVEYNIKYFVFKDCIRDVRRIGSAKQINSIYTNQWKTVISQ